MTGGVSQHAFYDILALAMLATLAAPVLAPVLAAVVLVNAWFSDLTYRHVAALIGSLAVFVYGCGAWSAHIWDLRGADEYCRGDLARAPTTLLLPLIHTCHLADGTTHQLVPAVVNPTLLACLIGGIVVLVRGRRRPQQRR